MTLFPLYVRASTGLNVRRQEVLTVVSTRAAGRVSNVIMNNNGHSHFLSKLYLKVWYNFKYKDKDNIVRKCPLLNIIFSTSFQFYFH